MRTIPIAKLATLTALGSALVAFGCNGDIGGVEPKPHDDDTPHECSVDDDCGDAMVCDGGRCEPNFDPGNGNGGTGHGGGNVCADVNVTFTPVTPNVVLLIDQSGSMTASYPGGNRWDVLHDALMNPSDGVVKSLEDQVSFGLALYTSNEGNQGGVCPLVTEVALSLGGHAAIDAVYSSAQPVDETPTGESLAQVADTLAALDLDGPRIIILATDGEPDTCAVPNPQNGQAVSIAAAQAAYANGVETFILGVGNEVGASHLQDMANAGAGLDVGGTVNAPFYQPQNKQDLVDTFTSIIDGQRSCLLTLDGEVDPDLASQGVVTLDGVPLGYQDPNGWQLVGTNQIELLGTACEAIKSGEHDISGTFPCGAIIPAAK